MKDCNQEKLRIEQKLTIKQVNIAANDLNKNRTDTSRLKANMKMARLMIIQMQVKLLMIVLSL